MHHTIHSALSQLQGHTSALVIRILCGDTNVSLSLDGVGPSLGPTTVFFKKCEGKHVSLFVRSLIFLANSELEASSPSKARRDVATWRARVQETANRLLDARVSIVSYVTESSERPCAGCVRPRLSEKVTRTSPSQRQGRIFVGQWR
jgi:hypothetical protein